MHKIKRAFTMIELIFVIVIIGILSKFGVEFLAQAYNSFIFSSINNSLQSRSASAIEIIGSRLQFRIKDSVIARKTTAPASFQAIGGSTLGDDATVLEWVGVDIDGLRGDTGSLWSGIVDIQDSNATSLDVVDMNRTALNTLITTLSPGGNDLNNSALYFIGSDSNFNGYGWNAAAAFINQNNVMHPVVSAVNNNFAPTVGSFNGVDVYEYFQLAWTAYAVELNPATGDLTLWYDYQPWEGEAYNTGTGRLLMEDVDTFRFKSVGSVMKIQICVNSDVIDDYSLCKEKTIY